MLIYSVCVAANGICSKSTWVRSHHKSVCLQALWHWHTYVCTCVCSFFSLTLRLSTSASSSSTSKYARWMEIIYSGTEHEYQKHPFHIHISHYKTVFTSYTNKCYATQIELYWWPLRLRWGNCLVSWHSCQWWCDCIQFDRIERVKKKYWSIVWRIIASMNRWSSFPAYLQKLDE